MCKNYNDNCREMAKIYMFLGKTVYKLLKTIKLPPGHPSLNKSLLLLANGCPLPPGHPSLEDILRLALGCKEDNSDDSCSE